jgi:NAD(P)-dependent dehydrogenase (short-subunit alcohol dehydrogenase family)
MGAGWKTVVGVLAGGFALRGVLHARRRYDFNGRVALISGGSRGLGLALARELAARGARLALCARDDAELEDARRELAGLGADVLAVPCDVTSREEVRHLVKRVRETFGQIDVLVNNAGVIEVGPLETMQVEDFEEAMRTHFYGPLYLCLEVMPELRRRRDGRIINISSFGGKVAVPHLTPYCASKFALAGLSDGLRAELAGENVFVTTVCPGLMRTGSARHAKFKGHPLLEFRMFRAAAVLPLLTMEPQRAARRIIAAARWGRAELVLTPQAKLAVKARALFPELVGDVLGLLAGLLPDGFGGSREQVKGEDLQPPRGGSLFDRLLRHAALRFNEYRV